MKKKKHYLSDLWESYPEFVTSELVRPKQLKVAAAVADIFALGPYYSYVIDMTDYSTHQIHEDILKIHTLSDYPKHLQDIIDLIHPDDLDFVWRAERATIETMKAIGLEFQLRLKTSYCFRMRVDDGVYHLFHHQAIHLAKDTEGHLLYALNIHTDIQHITTVNNCMVLVAGVGDRKDYHQMDLSGQQVERRIPKLSAREMEILIFIANGHSSMAIADMLFISIHTIRVHRKNLLKKTNSENSSDLIRKCMEWGLL